MPKIMIVAATIAGALALAATAAFGQGVAPGGPIGNSTGIGSGTGPQTGTGPTWPNGTNQAPQPQISPPPLGGGGAAAPPPAAATSRPSPTLQPRTSSGRMPPPATEPLVLPDRPTEDLAFLKGCWRTDVFQSGQRSGLSTWCFDGKGAGRFLYTRIDQPNFFCHAQAQAAYEGPELQLHGQAANCGDGTSLPAEFLSCRAGDDKTARCRGNPTVQRPDGDWTVRLYKVRYHPG